MQLPSQTTKVFGPPGSGKTTFLLNVVDTELQSGVHPTQIGYFAFTRKAATEARDRASAKFEQLNPGTDFPWFRTLHSLAYHCLGVTRKDMMSPQHFAEFAAEAGLEIAVSGGEEEFIVNSDNPILNEVNIARIRGEDLRAHYNRSDMSLEWFHFEFVERAYRQYKDRNGVMDFTDLLERIVEVPERLPRLETLIIDEAQDLSRLQWRLVKELAARSNKLFIAGDDDQAVYAWAGADVESFLAHSGAITVLDQSYRVPAKIHALANTVVSRIRQRQPKVWKPRQEQGSVSYHSAFENVDLTSGEWLILAPANYLLNEVQRWLMSQGLLFERYGQRSIPDSVLHAVVSWERLRSGKTINATEVKNLYKYLGSNVQRGFKTLNALDPESLFSMQNLTEKHGLLTDAIWHEALVKIAEDKRHYIISLLRRGLRLNSTAPIKLSTIHGAKGGEADNVMLFTDLSTRFMTEYTRNPDSINRILYVGITRARKALHVILPKNSEKCFRL
jgi:superfamily I DNA/RNA helicase